MEDRLSQAWRVWDDFCSDTARRIQESVDSGLPPAPAQEQPLRAALAALTPEEIAQFLDDPRLEERHPDPGSEKTLSMRFAMLLCFLPPPAAVPLALRYDDPCRAKSNLPPRASLELFLTLRWKAFLLSHLRREGAIVSLHAARHQIQGFVERSGDASAKALLKTSDTAALARELAKTQKSFPSRPKP